MRHKIENVPFFTLQRPFAILFLLVCLPVGPAQPTLALGGDVKSARGLGKAARELVVNPDAKHRAEAAKEIGRLLRDLHGVRRSLARGLRDPDEEVRYESVRALGILGPSAYDVVPMLKLRLFDKSPRVRVATADALSEMRQCGREATPELCKAMADGDRLVRARVAMALGLVDAHAGQAVPVLVKALQDSDRGDSPQRLSTRTIAAYSLGTFGRNASIAVPVLVENLKTSRQQFRCALIWALGEIRSQKEVVVPLLRQILAQEKQKDCCGSAARALAAFGPDAREAIPDLVRLLQAYKDMQTDEGNAISCDLIAALGLMKAHAKPAVPTLMEICRGPNRGLYRQCFVALSTIGPVSDEIAPFLIGCLRDARYSSADVVVALQGMSKQAVPQLVAALGQTPGPEKANIIIALGALGPLARDAIPALERELVLPRFAPIARMALARIRGQQ